MSHFETHSLCNKLQKWMNIKSLSTAHCQGANHLCSHTHVNSKNPVLMSSPYKKTSFENLLRTYPKQYEEIKNPRLNFDPKTKENPKRTFESRVIKYDNIKSRIDTNLGVIKSVKIQSIISEVNDQNKNTQNIAPCTKENQNENLTYQKPSIKKIKLNTQNFLKFQQKDISNINDSVEEMIQNHKFWSTEYTQEQPGKTLFKINLSKKINMCKKSEDQQFNCNNTHLDVNYSPMNLETPLKQPQHQDQKQSHPESSEKMIQIQSSSKLTFMELKQKVFQEKIPQSNQETEYHNGIFTLDGYMIMGDNESEQDESEDAQSQYHSTFEFTQKKLLIQIQQSENQAEDSLKQLEKPQEAKNISSEVIQKSENKQILQIQEVQNPLQITQSYPQQVMIDKENINSNIFTPRETQKIKVKRQNPSRKQSKPKKQTKILTRSKQEKLNLFNKLSMRLIRKKYGYELSHSDLADRMLSEECKVELKAFIESESLKFHKTIFNFNELSTTQMKNTLVKYFGEEEASN